MKKIDNFGETKFYVWKETFAIIRTKKPLLESFAIIQDKNEITSVIDQSKVSDKELYNAEKDWKLITFNATLSFESIGFLSRIFRALADEQISIFAISAYSTDHILVKQKDLDRTIKKLKSIGFRLRNEGSI